MNREEMIRKIKDDWKKHSTAIAFWDFSNTTDESLLKFINLIEELETKNLGKVIKIIEKESPNVRIKAEIYNKKRLITFKFPNEEEHDKAYTLLLKEGYKPFRSHFFQNTIMIKVAEGN